MTFRRGLLFLALLVACACFAAAWPEAPFKYLWGTAYHVLPETHNNESGYFAVMAHPNGKVYVGTAKYGVNSYLVEFDPSSGTQRIVIDTNKVCGTTGAGEAAQSKIHTKLYVGPSGMVYCGSMHGHHKSPGSGTGYPGGYVMRYDPKTGKAESLGMPMKEDGVIDVIADEGRGLLYVCTIGVNRWLVGSMKDKTYRDLGVTVAAFAATMVDKQGRAHTLTDKYEVATYDPKTQKVQVRPIFTGKTRWETKSQVPIWVPAPDGRYAYLIMMNDPTLLKIDLLSTGKVVQAVNLGKMTDGKNPDSRNGLSMGPDGRIYALIRIDNATGFGSGHLHHLLRYDPQIKKHEDLGVLAVRNPDFFNWKGKDGKAPPWSHGYHTLPDGTLTPLHGHQGLTVAPNNTVYATILYPYTLLKIDAVRKPVRVEAKPAEEYVDFVLKQCDTVEKDMPHITAVAEVCAKRHLAGGGFDFPWNYQGLQQELSGRSGGMVSLGRMWKKDRTAEEKANDMAIIGWDRAPGANEAARLQGLKKQGVFIIGFGPKDLPALAECAQLCDAFFDTGLPDDRAVTLRYGSKAGRTNHLVNTLYGWAFIGEVVGALTRQGKMPPVWKSYAYTDGVEWGNKYHQKVQFHDDLTVPPQPAGKLGKDWLAQMRDHMRRFKGTQLPGVYRAADLIQAELDAGRTPYVLSSGHMPWVYVGKYEDARWMKVMDFHATVEHQVKEVREKLPEDTLAVRIGYFGENQTGRDLYHEKKARLIMITSDSIYPEMKLPDDMAVKIDMGMAFGDACVTLDGYPIKLFPPSGVMQIVAYEAINTEVLARIE
ncbi:MAG: NHL repeat-containing protein [Armatimonadota bacterium]